LHDPAQPGRPGHRPGLGDRRRPGPALAAENGTLDWAAQQALRLCRGNAALMPLLYFGLALALATIGAGNIAAAALVAPTAMATARRAGISSLVMAILVAHGAIAGALSPISPTGIIANGLLEDRLGLKGHGWTIYWHNALANLLVALAGYVLLGGWRPFRRREHEEAGGPDTVVALKKEHGVTLGVIGLLVVAVVGFGAHVGMAAFAAAALLILGRMADEAKALARVPWGVILMVCGVTVLTALLEKTGGADRLTQIIGLVSTPRTVTGVVAFLSGAVSVYSSTSGVVLPAFLPLVPGLARALPGSDPLAIASAMIVGGHLVDSSPLSTIGALCVASAAAEEDRSRLFNKVLAWGLSMAVVGAVGCYLFF
jgi:di/tricarboxylate transporter